MRQNSLEVIGMNDRWTYKLKLTADSDRNPVEDHAFVP